MTATATKRTHSVDFIVCAFVAMWALLLTGMPLSAVAEKTEGDQQAGTFTDSRDGRVYRTATIGHQVWMAENLAYKPAEGSYWAYDNNQSNAAKYGYLYNFETARKVCATGWHLPTTGELEQLMKSAGGTDGTKIYSALTSDGNEGFFALFGGFRDSDGKFKDLGKSAKFWSTSVLVPMEWLGSLVIYSEYGTTKIGLDEGKGRAILGFSVRCTRDK